ncbi:glycosyltransferase [Vibrio vulnificus]|uniref:glycosyltransferase n=1 Tax=Vibrio vulnificus TaxID=672 RepID=UPI001A313916|nr:glycosyltransferase [Vibrio vulnificus]ELY5143592.1 glycosyltransferase [Vibrio vulnificus]MCA0779102.1 glycosyltransferase [Vibrio vulnificus]MCU8115776.1 glycosyltransferase [Vibrio vulnificus]WIL74476.1 glycosyltransferase [Vibrio vulnificus]HAS6240026.1 glycosyltransferase [Vibrio vulnificus]
MENNYLIVISSLGGGGAERVASELSNYISDTTNDKVSILILERNLISYKINSDIDIIVSPLSKFSKGVFKLLLLPLHSYYLSRVVKKRNITKVISFLHRPNIVNSMSSLFQNRDFIFSERSLISCSYKGFGFKLMRLLLKLAYMKTNKCIAISEAVKQEILSIGVNEDRVVVINNPVFIAGEYQVKKFTRDRFKFCTAGRLVKSKNIDLLIKAFTEFLKFKPDSILNIYGIGPELDNLLKLTEKLGVSDKVNFNGFSERLDVDLSNNDCFIFASQYESFGNVIIEAASVGLPIIVPGDLQSLDDIFSDRNHCLNYSERKPEIICAMMIQLMCKVEYEKYSENSIKTSKKFNKKIILNRYISELGD